MVDFVISLVCHVVNGGERRVIDRVLLQKNVEGIVLVPLRNDCTEDFPRKIDILLPLWHARLPCVCCCLLVEGKIAVRVCVSTSEDGEDEGLSEDYLDHPVHVTYCLAYFV